MHITRRGPARRFATTTPAKPKNPHTPPRPSETFRYDISREPRAPPQVSVLAEGDLGTYMPLPAGRDPAIMFFVSCIYRLQAADPNQDLRALELTVDHDLYRRRCSELCDEFLRLESDKFAQRPEYLAGAQLLLRDPRLLKRLREEIAKMRRLSEKDLLGRGWGPVPRVVSALCRTGDVSDVPLLHDWMHQPPQIAEVVCNDAPPM